MILARKLLVVNEDRKFAKVNRGVDHLQQISFT